MKRKLTCIICPRGCEMCFDDENGEITGNTCPRGKAYGIAEMTNPTRTVTASVAVSNRPDTFVSVKTSIPVPKSGIFDVMNVIHGIKTVAPIKIGDIIKEDVCGADIVATKNIE